MDLWSLKSISFSYCFAMIMWILESICWDLHDLFLSTHARLTLQTQYTPVKRAKPITTTFPWASWRFSSPFLSSLVLKRFHLPSSFGLSLFPSLSELDISSFGARLEDRNDSVCESITSYWFSPCSNLSSALCTTYESRDRSHLCTISHHYISSI